MNQIASSVL